ncbi:MULTISPECIES: hypothetical protein [Acetobacteraceae]|uniref:DUF2782 domain-containing protein n=3 Tax=Acetobacteraceae TaxID=433 RepID=A0A7U7J0X9_9PROT|nr:MULTISPECIES: hypothetical protein [Acetobacteraceae]MCQ0042189.1 hypothetical protein [Bombella sp.]MCT6813267.1 hypothetical protein [Bombella apis]MCT6820290.1 hypothetical protein [Bombella apis]MCT6846006.1 hypothetical protein [Bombella apis]CDG33541.1 hypothetical protein SACS_0803 [Parasaccharibacter apium]
MRFMKQAGLLAGTGMMLMGVAGLAPAQADEADSVVRKPMPGSSLPRVHADYSMFHFVPRGDEVTVQPERNRLLFRKKSGQPDGYGERRGAAIVYYDSSGKPVRIQRLTPEELDRMNQ